MIIHLLRSVWRENKGTSTGHARHDDAHQALRGTLITRQHCLHQYLLHPHLVRSRVKPGLKIHKVLMQTRIRDASRQMNINLDPVIIIVCY